MLKRNEVVNSNEITESTIKDSHHRLLPLVEYETGRFPSLRIFNGARREEFSNFLGLVFANEMSKLPIERAGALTAAAEHFERFSSLDKILLDLAATEFFDILSLSSRDLLAQLRSIGSIYLQESGAEEEQSYAEVASHQNGLHDRSQHSSWRLLGEEFKHAFSSLESLIATSYTDQITSELQDGSSAIAKIVHTLSPERLTQIVAKTISLLSDETYTTLYHGIGQEDSGLAPFYRVVSISDIEQLARFELRGWFASKELEQDLSESLSFSDWTESRQLPKMDKPFIPLMTIQHLKAMRVWGTTVLEHVVDVGRRIKDVGYSEDPKSFEHMLDGLRLIDGSQAIISPNVSVLMAFYRHQAWVEERERSFRYDDRELVRPPRSKHYHFDPRLPPGEDYEPDLIRAYGFAHSLALLCDSEKEKAAKLYSSLNQLSTSSAEYFDKQKSWRYVSTVPAEVLALHQGTLVDLSQIKNRFERAFLATKERVPGEVIHGTQRSFSDLSIARALFEVIYGGNNTRGLQALPLPVRSALVLAGEKIIEDSIDLSRPIQEIGESIHIPLRGGNVTSISRTIVDTLSILGRNNYYFSENTAREIARRIRRPDVSPPGNGKKFQDYHLVIDGFEDEERARYRLAALGNAFLLAERQTSSQHSENLEDRCCSYYLPPLPNVVPFSLVQKYSVGLSTLIKARAKNTEISVDQLFSSTFPDRSVSEALEDLFIGYAGIDALRYLGQSELLYMRNLGKMAAATGRFIPDKARIPYQSEYRISIPNSEIGSVSVES